MTESEKLLAQAALAIGKCRWDHPEDRWLQQMSPKIIAYFEQNPKEELTPEPIGTLDHNGNFKLLRMVGIPIGGTMELYERPAPRTFLRLTDKEIQELLGPFAGDPIRGYTRKLFDEIQDKLEEKNK